MGCVWDCKRSLMLRPFKEFTQACVQRADPSLLGSLQRLKAAVHYTVGCLCEEVAEDKDVQFSKQTIAAISEITFRQCGTEVCILSILFKSYCWRNGALKKYYWN